MRLLDREERITAASKATQAIARFSPQHVSEIWLHGSVAENRDTLGSDVDLYVRTDGLERHQLFEFGQRLRTYLEDLNFLIQDPGGLDITVARETLEDPLCKKFYQEVKRKGHILYRRERNINIAEFDQLL